MSLCKVTSTNAWKTVEKLKFDVEPGFFHTKDFLANFGNWTNEKLQESEEDRGRVNGDGSPTIFSTGSGRNAYYLDKNGVKQFLANIKFKTIPIDERSSLSEDIVNDLFNQLARVLKDFSDLAGSKIPNMEAYYDRTTKKMLKENRDYEHNTPAFNALLEKTLREDKKDYLEAIDKRLKLLGIKYDAGGEIVTPKESAEITDEQEEVVVNSAIKQLPSMRRSSKDKASKELQSFLMFLPKHNKNGTIDYSRVFPNRPINMGANAAWNILKEEFKNLPMLEGADNIKLYMDRLKSLQKKYPWTKKLYNRLNLKVNGERNLPLQIAFVSSMHNVKNSIITTEFKKDGTLIIRNTAESGLGQMGLLKTWARDINIKLFPRGNKDMVEAAKVERLVGKANKELGQLLTKKRTELSEEGIEDKLSKVAEILSGENSIFGNFDINIGLDAIKADFYTSLEQNNAGKKNNLSPSFYLNLYIGTLRSMMVPKTSMFTQETGAALEKVLISGNKILKKLAIESVRLDNVSATSSATLGKNKVYLNSLPPVFHQNINLLRANPERIRDLLKLPHLRNSLALKAWADNPLLLEKAIPALRGAIQKEGESSKGMDSSDIKRGDYARGDNFGVLRVENGNHNPIYPTQIPADKGREYLSQMGIFRETANIEEAKPIFVGYLHDELGEMIAAKLEIDAAIREALNARGLDSIAKSTPEEQQEVLEEASQGLIMGYTLTQDGQIGRVEGGEVIYEGSAFEFKLFPDMNNPSIKDNPKFFVNGAPIITLESPEISESLVSNLLNNVPEVDGIITATLQKNIEVVKKYYLENGLGLVVDNTKLSAENKSFDRETIKYYLAKYENNAAEAKEAMFRDYALNSIISKIEYMKLHTGSLQYYKHNADYIKRVPGTYIDGIPVITGITEGDTHFRQFTFKTEEFDSALSKLNKEWSNTYKGVDRTDAQAWITPKRWLFLLERTAKINNVQAPVIAKIKRQMASMKQGNPIIEEDKLTAKEINIISAQPLKGVYQKITLETGGVVYNKYSQAVLLPQFVENLPKAKALLNYMEANNVDEAIAQTGIKAGAKKANPLFDENGNFLAPHKNAIQVMDNRNWRLQQDLPTKGMHDNKIGTQLQKIIVSGLRYLGDKPISPNGKSGNELADAIDQSLMDLSNEGIEQFKSKYGIEEDFKIKNLTSFYRTIIQDLEKDGKGTEEALEVLSKEYSPSSIPSMEKQIMSSFMASLKRSGVNLLTSGGAYIQISDHLIGKPELNSESGIKVLVDDFSALKPPRVQVDEKTGRNVVLPGQVFVPHGMIEELIPNYTELDDKTLREMLSAPHVLELIGYRIPTQSRASTDILEIVGILPKEMGDSVIAYGEITAKTGSDFDIDKMFFMAPTLKMGLTRLQLDNTDKMAKLQNNTFRLFSEALKTPALYDAMMTSIDNDTTETSIRAFEEKKAAYGLQVFNPVEAIETRFSLKAGQAGIGEMVNALSDHIRQQGKDIKLHIKTGTWGSKDNRLDLEYSESLTKKETQEYLKHVNAYRASEGKSPLSAVDIKKRKIADVLSELTNAFVDIANKDAFITKANWGSVMNAYGTMLLRRGVHPAKIFAMFQQPVIKKMVSTLSFKEGIIDNKSSFEIRKKQLNTLRTLYTKELKATLKKDEKMPDFDNSLSGLDFELLLVGDSATPAQRRELAFIKNQYIILSHFDEMVPTVRAYNAGVTSSKLGETGLGKSPGNTLVIENKIDMAADMETSNQEGYTDKFYDKEGNETLLMTFYRNQIGLFNSIVENNPTIFFGFQQANKNILNSISMNTSGSLLTSVDKAEKLFDEIKKFTLSGFPALNGNPIVAELGDTIETLNDKFEQREVDRKTNIDELFKLKGKYKILSKLNSDIVEGREELSMHRVKDLESPEKSGLIASWQLLIDNEPKLGRFLVQEAYAKSGFAVGPMNFAELIPPMFLIEEGIEEYIKDNSVVDLESFEDQLFRNKKISAEIFTTKELLTPIEGYPGLMSRVLKLGKSAKKYLQYQPTEHEEGMDNPDFGHKLLGVATYSDNKQIVQKVAIYETVAKVKNGSYYNTDHSVFLKQVEQKFFNTRWPSQIGGLQLQKGSAVSANEYISEANAEKSIPHTDLIYNVSKLKTPADNSEQSTPCVG